jgi:3-phenylpropionate/cinnamic acid dioxygenase small subunit
LITDLTVDIQAIDDLLGRYAQVLDDQNWDLWTTLFSEECSYEVHTLDNAQRGLPLAYMLDDNRARVIDRVKFITEVWAGTIEPYRTRHVSQRTSCIAIDTTTRNVRSNFQVSYSEADGPPAILASGYYDDLIQLAENSALFRARRVYLDGMPARYLVYPL